MDSKRQTAERCNSGMMFNCCKVKQLKFERAVGGTVAPLRNHPQAK